MSDRPVEREIVYVKRGRGCTSYIGIGILVLIVVGAIAYLARPKEETAKPSSTVSTVVVNAQPAPSLAELASQKSALTDAQWDAYSTSLKGKRISGWVGTVQSVDQKPFSSDVYTMVIDVAEPARSGAAFDLRVDLAKADALRVNKGQTATVTGLIRKVDCVITYCPIELDSATYTLK